MINYLSNCTRPDCLYSVHQYANSQQIQSSVEICLSTVEAEYVALSQAMRDLIPLMDHTEEMDGIFQQSAGKPVVNYSLFLRIIMERWK